jgi:hypothetical protein
MANEADAGVMAKAVDEVTAEIVAAFKAIWERPDAVAIMVAFREGQLAFMIDKGGVRFVSEQPQEPEPPIGGYL